MIFEPQNQEFGTAESEVPYRNHPVLCLFSHGCGRKFRLRLCEEGTAGVTARTIWKGGPAILTIQSTATESLHSTHHGRRGFFACQFYEDYFPATEYASYDAFLNADGEPVKLESRTRVVLLQRRDSKWCNRSGCRDFSQGIAMYYCARQIR